MTEPTPKKSDLPIRTASAVVRVAVAGTALWLGGDTLQNHYSTVILNSFQDPSRPIRGAVWIRAEPANKRIKRRPVSYEKWVLKRVQDDDNGKVRV